MMISFEKITRYDMVKVIRVPDEYKGLIDVGDIGIVVEQLDADTFEIECVTPDGSFKWLETLNVRFISKYLGSAAAVLQTAERRMLWNSVRLGTFIGAIVGAITGLGLGAITMSMNGILIGLGIGLLLGLVTGAGSAALTVKTAGTTGGVGVGYFTGMLFGGVFGMFLGALIPASLRMQANTHSLPVLDALMMGRFETAVLVSFFLSILATIVGVWIGGRNYVPRNKKES